MENSAICLLDISTHDTVMKRLHVFIPHPLKVMAGFIQFHTTHCLLAKDRRLSGELTSAVAVSSVIMYSSDGREFRI